jgi:hypothetical protein
MTCAPTFKDKMGECVEVRQSLGIPPIRPQCDEDETANVEFIEQRTAYLDHARNYRLIRVDTCSGLLN